MELLSPPHCLLCWGNCSPQNEAEETPLSLLGRQLKAVFVLRELLRLPPEKLTEFLEGSGGNNPHEWIRFCDTCQLLVEEAFSLFEQKVKIHRKLKKVQQEVILKVKGCQSSEGVGKRNFISDETRDFVNNHEYGAFEDPFVAIDGKAVQMRVKEEDDAEYSEHSDNFGDLPIDSGSSDGGKSVKIRPGTQKTKKSPRKSKQKGDGGSRKSLPKHTLEEGETFKDANGQTKYRCLQPNCARKEFDKRKNFVNHKQVHRDNPDYVPPDPHSWYTCDLCKRSFLGHKGLRTHKTISHPEVIERPFPCGECSLSFTTLTCRRRHVRKVHQGRVPTPIKPRPPKRRQCPHCPYNTISTSELQVHITQKHEGQHPLHCEHCGVGCSREAVLRVHQAKLHFLCSVKGCGLQLADKEQLHDHEVGVHGKEINVYRCDKCGECAVGRNNFKMHKDLKHPPGEGGEGKQHICELCGKSFPVVKYLNYHIKYSHNKAPRKRNDGSNQD